jgi:hypothetical protein
MKNFKGWQDIETFLEWEERMEKDCQEAAKMLALRERSYKIDWPMLAFWAMIVALTGMLYGFIVAWLYPVIHRLLAKAGWL